MIEYALKALRNRYTVTEREIPEYSRVESNGMTFYINAYEIAGIGNFSTVRMDAMMGAMKMDTVVLTPLAVDAPMFSYDRILAMGNDTLLTELYDTCLQASDVSALQAVKDSYAFLPDNDLGTHWYDDLKLSPSLSKKGTDTAETFRQLQEAYFDAYLDLLASSSACTPEEKRKKTAAYVDGLFTNGGPAADNWKRMIGEGPAKEMFAKYIFASEE